MSFNFSDVISWPKPQSNREFQHLDLVYGAVLFACGPNTHQEKLPRVAGSETQCGAGAENNGKRQESLMFGLRDQGQIRQS